MTLPKFLSALANIGNVIKELSPKTDADIVKEIAEQQREEMATKAKAKKNP